MNTIHSISRFWTFKLLVSTIGLVVVIGCACPTPPASKTPHKQKLRENAPTLFDETSSNWPLPPKAAESLMRAAPMRVESESYAGAGTSGASRIEVRYLNHPMLFTFKWKTMPSGLDGINNSPRREVASYQAQTLFLDPINFVIPPSVARCLPPATFAEPERHDSRVWKDSNCELGILSLWLDDVEIPRPLYDAALFASNPTYARYLADFNLLTYLIRHRDGRDGNFLIAKDSSRPITFAIDNGMTFGGFFFNWFVDNWDDIEVPALSRESIDRLRLLTEQDLENLGVVTELHVDAEGIYRSVSHGENLDREKGVRTKPGVIQFGLTEDEIEDLSERIEDLLEDVDDGKIPLF